jgi:uncharacterized protein (DUF488 family)
MSVARRIYTIGFTKRSAEDFFETLRRRGIKRVVDVRLRNTSTLAGFTKKDDLRYLLRKVLRTDYVHEPALAPTKEILKAYKQTKDWENYERDFVRLLRERGLPSWLNAEALDVPSVLLCSEPDPAQCHRRLVAEYLAKRLGGVKVVHL